MLEETESIYTYQRENDKNLIEKKKSSKNKAPYFKKLKRRFFLYLIKNATILNFALLAAGILFGRVVLLGELYPFGVAYTAGVFWNFRNKGFLAAAGVLTGFLSIFKTDFPLSYTSCIILTGLFVHFVPRDIRRPWLVVPGIVLSGVMVVKGFFLAFNGAIPYDYISLFFEALFSGLFTLAVIYAIPAILAAKYPGELKGEEIFCIITLLGGIVAGANNISWGFFSLDVILSYFFILLAALTGGCGLGAATGAVVGVIPGLAYSAYPGAVSAYSISGLLAGLFRLLGKPGVILGFLLSSIIVTVYTLSYHGLPELLAQTAVAAFILFLIPKRWIYELKRVLFLTEQDNDSGVPNEKVKEVISEKTSQWSGVIDEIAESFEQAAVAGYAGDNSENNLQELFNEVGSKVCKGCTYYSVCWEREFYKTYQTLLNLFSVADKYGRVTVSDIDEEMLARCSRCKEMAVAVTCLHEMFKINNYWTKRLKESKYLVSEQLRCISDVIDNLPGQLSVREEHYRKKSKAIRQKLNKMGVRVSSLDIYGTGSEYPEVKVTMPYCGGHMICLYEVGPFLSKELGCQLSMPAVNCIQTSDKDFCNFRVYPFPQYQFSLGVAGARKKGSAVSGDSYDFLFLPGGEFAVLISDGMGTGVNAAVESSVTLNLMIRMLDLGVNRGWAVKTINSVLMLSSLRESFATLDMNVVNIYDAGSEFVKVGASPSFLVRGQRVDKINSQSLPVGIVDEVEAFSSSKQLRHGDLIVMVSDGVLDSYSGPGNKEDWLMEVLKEASGLNPQETADLIINLAQTGSCNDDMTVITLKIEKTKK
ncbi:MAG: stage II sporulation protein E [Clostridiales bacterium]|nr:stage II sporulation protein E [Clostridiales bacterium]MCF8021584.1 stage II sporulation protein E [Clostridiales bacterium]